MGRVRSVLVSVLSAPLAMGLTAGVIATLIVGLSCQRYLPVAGGGQKCPDGCASMVCPAHMRCTVGPACAARCDPEELSSH